MWMIYTQHRESKPTTTLMFLSPYMCPIIAEHLHTHNISQSPRMLVFHFHGHKIVHPVPSSSLHDLRTRDSGEGNLETDLG